MEAHALASPSVQHRGLLIANAVSLVLAYVIPRTLTLLATVVAARVLGVAVFGQYSTAAALAVVVSIVATLGMQPLLVREMARAPGRAPELMAAAHTIKAGTVVLMAVAFVAASAVGFPPVVLAAAALLGAGYGVGAFVENLAGYFQGVEQMHVWTQASTLMGLVAGGLGIFLAIATHRVLWFCAAPVVGQTAALAWLLWRAPAAVRRPPLPSAAAIASLVRQLIPFAIAFIATTLYYRADVLILARLRGAGEVGLYSAAYKFLDVTQALALAGAGALLPRLSRLSRSGIVRRAAVRRLFGFVISGAIPLAMVLFLVRGTVVDVLYGPGYEAAVPVLALLAPAVVPLAINMFALSALAAANSMMTAAIPYLAAVVFNVALNLAWAPHFGALGAAAAALISETALALTLLAALWTRCVR